MDTYLISTLAIGIVSLIIFLCLFLLPPFKASHLKEPPIVHGAWPILGHLPLLSGSSEPLHMALGSMTDKYGPLFTIKLGATKTIVLSSSEMAKECFTKNDMVVSSRPKLVAIENLSYNFTMVGFAPYGSYWRKLRKIVTLELLSNRRIELLAHIRVSEVGASIKELVSVWSDNKNSNNDEYVFVEMKKWFSELAFNTVLRMIVGKRYFGSMDAASEEKAKRCLKTMREFMHLVAVFTVGDAIPYLRWLDLGGHEKAMKKIAKELDEILSEWLEEHRKNRVLDEQDFMGMMLLILRDNDIDGINVDTIIKATTLAMIVGGVDTVTVTLTWAMCLLMRNPNILEKAKEELDTQVGNQRCIKESDINKMVYLQAIVKETLRLCPAAPLSAPREFTQDCTLGGYHIKKGTQLITNIWKINTNSQSWPYPLEFKPERFLTTHKDVDVRGHHFELLPFGSGRRMCPGVSFGLQMVHFTLASFLHSFEILNPSSEPVDMTGILGLTNVKATPLEVLVKPRFSPDCYDL
ncbi:cytochrome P450 82A1-like [Arachis duranensis]|uniref:Cytochrome P450 82A1-like n=1 Tax=Arachis duranensis TaxID=130453 RepID=A0A6P4DF57_ARADU|nr:cytochrome P450 82A1-like [Arachis duranensis]